MYASDKSAVSTVNAKSPHIPPKLQQQQQKAHPPATTTNAATAATAIVATTTVQCRGNFPHDIRKRTVVAVKQVKKKTKDGKNYVHSSLELLTKQNGHWLNPHCRPLMESWHANMDFCLIIDVDKIVSYMTKCVTKSEKAHTSPTRPLFFSTLNRVSNDGGYTLTDLKKLMRDLHGEHQRSKQEMCHLINSIPLVHCSHCFKKVNLQNDSS
jgi:hypothetical protein